MIIVLKPDATEENLKRIVERLESLGLKAHISKGKFRTIIGAVGDEAILQSEPLEAMDGVEKVLPILKPFKLVSREFKPDPTVIRVNGLRIGSKRIHVIAGPCAVENKEMIIEIAKIVKKAGATILRGGAFKPRTSPYSFQGLGVEGLKYLSEAKKITGMPVITEVMDPRDIEDVCEYADIIQVGARNMQNFKLLKEIGLTKIPVMLKRGLSATIQEWLMSAEYIVSQGNNNVILCERGIRTFETATRNTLDLSAIPVVKQLSHLPVFVDPSHGVGRWDIILPMSMAAIAAGADGIMVEVHNQPEKALCDGPQALKPDKFLELMKAIKKIAKAVGRNI